MKMNDGAISPSIRTTSPVNMQRSSSFDRTPPTSIMVNKINSPQQSRLIAIGSANMLGGFDSARARGLSGN